MPLEADRADRAAADPAMHWAAGFGPDSADLFIRQVLTIDTDPETVFVEVTKAKAWPAWVPGVRRCDAPAEIGRGRMFHLELYDRAMDVSIAEWEPPHRFGWAGVAADLSVYHAWLLRELPDGRTSALVEVAARGPSACGVPRSRETMLRASYLELLLRLKARSEEGLSNPWSPL